jgi:hypothetical protein
VIDTLGLGLIVHVDDVGKRHRTGILEDRTAVTTAGLCRSYETASATLSTFGRIFLERARVDLKLAAVNKNRPAQAAAAAAARSSGTTSGLSCASSESARASWTCISAAGRSPTAATAATKATSATTGPTRHTRTTATAGTKSARQAVTA